MKKGTFLIPSDLKCPDSKHNLPFLCELVYFISGITHQTQRCQLTTASTHFRKNDLGCDQIEKKPLLKQGNQFNTKLDIPKS